MNYEQARKVITAKGTARATWCRTLPPEAAWVTVADGSQWAFTGTFCARRDLAAFFPPADAPWSFPHAWKVVMEDRGEVSMLTGLIDQARAKTEKSHRHYPLWRDDVLTTLEGFYDDVKVGRGEHTGVFNAAFAPLLQQARRVVRGSGAARLAPALLLDDNDQLFAVIMPMRLEQDQKYNKPPVSLTSGGREVPLCTAAGLLTEFLPHNR